jgi:hypothetical protein
MQWSQLKFYSEAQVTEFFGAMVEEVGNFHQVLESR